METSQCDLSVNVPSNIYLTSGPDADIDFEFAVKQVKSKKKKNMKKDNGWEILIPP